MTGSGNRLGSGRYTDGDMFGRHVLQHHGARSDEGIIADGNASQDLGAGAESHPVTDAGTIRLVEPGLAEGDPVQ